MRVSGSLVICINISIYYLNNIFSISEFYISKVLSSPGSLLKNIVNDPGPVWAVITQPNSLI